MTSPSTTTPTTVAFFGSTGGVCNSILVHTLLAGIKSVALVRTPKRLHDQLTTWMTSGEVFVDPSDFLHMYLHGGHPFKAIIHMFAKNWNVE